MVQDRHLLTIYSSAVCNLNCSYCFIDKNPALQKVDKVLEESFHGDYYINFAKKVFPNPQQLREVQIWGGEPFLSLNRTFSFLTQLFKEYPNCNRIMMSTNFVSDEFLYQFVGLLNVLSRTGREMEFHLQLSLDGPSRFTDRGRGKGVTAKFLKKLPEFLECLHVELPPNLTLNINFKPTLDSISIEKLQTKEAVYGYFRFFDGLVSEIRSHEFAHGKVLCNPPIPNTACPLPHTKQDGIRFANMCRLCREVENDHSLANYSRVTPFPTKARPCDENPSYHLSGWVCNSGHGMVGLLPNDMVSLCHSGFTDLLGDFKKEMRDNTGRRTTLQGEFFVPGNGNPTTLPYDELEAYERKVSFFHKNGATSRLTNVTNQIRVEAFAGNIPAKYQDELEALRAARFVAFHTSFCFRDNMNVTGSISDTPIGLIRLLLNGAEDYIK